MTTIQKITIPEPCPQAWQEMTPNNEGRHCDRCAKTVVDFADMSDAELIRYLITHTGVCGRFSQPQLDAVNTQLYNYNLKADTGWKKWIMAAVLFGSTMFNKASGQSTITPPPKTEQNPAPSYSSYPLGEIVVATPVQREIKGQVLAKDDGLPVVGASVRVTGTNMGAVSDINGRFELSVPITAKQLTVSYIGYQTVTMNIDSTQDKIYDIKLTLSTMWMGEVMVIRQPFFKRIYYKFIRRPFRKIFS